MATLARRASGATGIALEERVYLILAAVFIAALVACNLIFEKFFTWTPFGVYTFEISAGILPYPITFLVTDVISEIYGRRRADQVVLAVVLLAQAAPQTTVSDAEFTKVFGLFGPVEELALEAQPA